MSVLVGTGDNIWSGLYVISSTLGFVILLGLLNVFYINPFGVRKWCYKGLLFVACMVVSVFIFGCLVVGLWHWERQSYSKEISNHTNEKAGKTEQNGTETPKEPGRKMLQFQLSLDMVRDQTLKKYLDGYRRNGAMLMWEL